MKWLQDVLSYGGGMLFVTVLAGMLLRRRYGRWWFFTGYLTWVSTSWSLMTFWPARFWTWDFWALDWTVSNLLCFATAIELAFRTFRWFPGAMNTVRWIVLLVLVTTLAQLVLEHPGGTRIGAVAGRDNAVVLNASVWLFTIIAGAVLWYRLPIAGFHKRILLSWVPYLLFITVFSNTLTEMLTVGSLLDAARQIAATALAGYWAHLAWRRDPPTLPIQSRERDRLPLADVAVAAASTVKLHRASVPDRPA